MGLITSVIVDNQLVDLDVAHARTAVSRGLGLDRTQENRKRMNGPVEASAGGDRAMSDFYASVCLAELAFAALLVVRLFIGPTVSDRFVALNTMSTQATLCVFFFAAFAQTNDLPRRVDLACSFSYLATIVWARYLERGFL